VHADVARYLSDRPTAVDDEGYRLSLVLLSETTASRTHNCYSRRIGRPSNTVSTEAGTVHSEMARHQDLAAATGLRTYFAERSSPWQRGANENFNDLARQFFPKNTDLSQHSHEHVRSITALLNERPRKTLGYQTPTARFRAAAKAC
jgi:IS30 family transposase